jgi:hypothetical protein
LKVYSRSGFMNLSRDEFTGQTDFSEPSSIRSKLSA